MKYILNILYNYLHTDELFLTADDIIEKEQFIVIPNFKKIHRRKKTKNELNDF